MIKNYFKISIRNLMKHRVFTAINVTGLAFGLTAFLLIGQYISFERSYDRQFTNSDEIYRLTTDQIVEGNLGTRDAMSFHPSGKVLKEELPEVLNYTTTRLTGNLVIRHGDRVIQEDNVCAADSNYFKLFDYEILAGNPETMLNEPNSLVLNESKAKAYFGDENPVGKSLFALGGRQRPFEVTGVIKDIPENTHLKYDMLMSLKSMQNRLDRDAWSGYNYYTYLQLQPGADIQALENKMPDLSRKYLGEETTLIFNLQPMVDIHLYSDFTYEPEIHGSADSVDFMVVISIFILIIAWVNYINLSTSRAIDRAKEVGLRKVIGAHKRQLMGQFLFESLLVNLFGAILAIGLSELFLPYFNQLLGKEITTHVWSNREFLTNLFMFFVIGTIVSGFYPAVVLSNFKPVVVLRGKFRNSKRGVLLRKGLVVFQFAASLALIASTFVVNKQVNYMLNKDLGIDIDYVVGFTNPSYSGEQEDEMREKFRLFKDELVAHSAILKAGMTSNLPGGGSSDINSMSGGVRLVGITERVQGTVYTQYNDELFIPTVKQEILFGRNFDTRASDSSAVILNEAMVEKLGIANPEEVLNQKIQFGRDPENNKINVIGIVKNFQRSSMKNKVEPTCYFYYDQPGNSVVKLEQSNYKAGIAHLEETWRAFFPDAPLEFNFLDERFEKLYTEDKRFGDVFGTFSVLALVVAVLGLFGLSAFMAMQRTKEVGVRKVLGASTNQIFTIFFKDFLILIGISALLGLPLVYFSMTGWLEGYAHRIDFPWILSLTSVVIVTAFALITVGYQTFRVAIMNPSKTLKYE